MTRRSYWAIVTQYGQQQSMTIQHFIDIDSIPRITPVRKCTYKHQHANSTGYRKLYIDCMRDFSVSSAYATHTPSTLKRCAFQDKSHTSQPNSMRACFVTPGMNIMVVTIGIWFTGQGLMLVPVTRFSIISRTCLELTITFCAKEGSAARPQRTSIRYLLPQNACMQCAQQSLQVSNSGDRVHHDAAKLNDVRIHKYV